MITLVEIFKKINEEKCIKFNTPIKEKTAPIIKKNE